MTFASYFARDFDGEDMPLTASKPPVVAPEAESEPDAAPRRLRLCAVLATLWYIAFASFEIASIIFLIQYPLEPAEYFNDPLAILIGLTIGFSLCGITLLVRGCARTE